MTESPTVIRPFGWPFRVALIATLAHLVMLVWSINVNYVNVDEAGQFGSGLATLKTGIFTPYRVNPPLPRLWAALPAAINGESYGLQDHQIGRGYSSRPEWEIISQMHQAHGSAYFGIVKTGRWMALIWPLIIIVVLYRWGREMFGPWAGTAAVWLWCFEPQSIAFGSSVISDVPGAAGGLVAGYLFWRYLQAPRADSAWFAGIGFGLALCTKNTWLPIIPLWCLAGFLVRFHRSHPIRSVSAVRQIGHTLLMAVPAWLMLCGSFGFADMGRPLGMYKFQSEPLAGKPDESAKLLLTHGGNRFKDRWMGSIPVPFPADFVHGIDLQRLDFERKMESYLRGVSRDHGWWHYYLDALLIKWPIGTLLLVVAGLVFSLIRPGDASWWVAVVLPGAGVLALVSSQTGFNHHLRYVLPAFPFFYLIAGRLVQSVVKYGEWRVICGAALLWSATATIWVAPHWMSYFNPIIKGGPLNGHKYLLDSNISWGQDLLFLKKWYDAHPEARPLNLAYFNFVDPEIEGIEYQHPPRDPMPGWYAIEVNHLYGYRTVVIPRTKPVPYTIDKKTFEWLRELKPLTRAGYSIWIYHVTLEQANQARHDRGLPPLTDAEIPR